MNPSVFQKAYEVELALFWMFFLGTVFFPLRWALLCIILAGNVTVIHPGFVSTSGVGWMNAVRGLLLPPLMLLRMVGFRLFKIRWRFPAKLWILLMLYALVSVLWSPFKLSGLKMVGFLASWFLLYLVFHLAWVRGLLNHRVVSSALWVSLILAWVQTYVLGGPFSGFERQFVSFTAMNSFAPFLVCLLALLLFCEKQGRFYILAVLACLGALILAGSRHALVEAFFVLFGWGLFRMGVIKKRVRGFPLGSILSVTLLALVVLLAFRAVMVRTMPQNRLNQLLNLASEPELADYGTFGFRLMMYQHVVSVLSRRSVEGLLFGSGTSSGGITAVESEGDFWGYTVGVDPNRTIHNEFLRAIFEWGVLGLSIMVILLFYGLRRAWRLTFQRGWAPGFAALALFPGIVLALSVENPLSFPDSAQGIGYLMVLSYAFSVRKTFENYLYRTTAGSHYGVGAKDG